MRIRLIKGLLLSLCLLSFIGEGLCQDLPAAESESSSALSLSQPLFDPVKVVNKETERFNRSPNLILIEDFSRALAALKEKKYAEMSRVIDEITFSAHIRGYHNLPDFSRVLLSVASDTSLKGESQDVRYLVKQATVLSPSDASILMSASSFYKDIGISKSLDYFFSSLKVLQKQPVFLVTILANLSLVILMALTISFFFASIIQMLTMSARIHRGLVSLSPWSLRGILPPLGLLALLVVPLYGGILFAMCIWGIVLSCSKSSRKKFGTRKLFGLSVAGLCLLWGIGLPVIAKIGFNLKQDSTSVFENINRFGFSPRGEKFVKLALKDNPKDIMHIFSHGIILKLKGQPERAAEEFSKVMALSSPGSYIYNSSQANLGVMQYEDGDYKRAFRIFQSVEARGQSDFELYYNLANVSTLVFKEDMHSHYYQKAKNADSSRLESLVEESNLTPKALLYSAPEYLLYSLLLKPVAETSEIRAAEINDSIQAVLNYLVFGLNAEGLMLFGLLSMLGVLILPSFTRKQSRDFKKSEETKAQWSLFPGSAPLAGDRPVLGALILSVSLVFLLAGVGTPLNFYGNFTCSMSLARESMFLSAVLFLLTTIFIAIFKRFSEVKLNG